MKPLPPNPQPYVRPPEYWFATYEYGGDPSASATNQAIIAMMLTLHDALGTKMRLDKATVTAIQRNAFKTFADRYGSRVMEQWRERCANLRCAPESDFGSVFIKLLTERMG